MMWSGGVAVHAVRFGSLYLVALTLGLAFAHVLELPGKLRLGGADWLTVQHNLYVGFGTAGAVVEVAAVLATWLAAYLVRDWGRPSAGRWRGRCWRPPGSGRGSGWWRR